MKKAFFISLLVIYASCTLDNSESKYLRWVGDSKINLQIDTADFQLCNSESVVKQYFHFDKGLQYEGEKKELEAHFKRHYVPVKSEQSGLVRIRFIVNCKGETGRFRIIGSDLDYNEQVFNNEIVSQLLHITQSLKGWAVLSKRDKPKDYYQYLIFKIVKGDLIDIMP